MSKRAPSRRVFLSVFLALSSLVPLHAQSFSLEAGLGTGFWGGAWNTGLRESFEGLGLSAGTLLSPAASAGLVWAGPKLFGPVRLRISTGLGLWSGGVGGRQGGDLERSGSLFAFALEAVPRLEAEFPLRRGALRTFLGLGAGMVVGPMLSVDMLPGLTSISKTPPEFLHRWLGIASIGIGYRTDSSLAFLLRAEGGISDFDAAPGTGTALMSRLLLAAEYPLTGKETRP